MSYSVEKTKDSFLAETNQYGVSLKYLNDRITVQHAHRAMDAYAEHYVRVYKDALAECSRALDWALNNTTADSESVQSDFFNILMNARTAADKCLNPNLPENQPFDPDKQVNF